MIILTAEEILYWFGMEYEENPDGGLDFTMEKDCRIMEDVLFAKALDALDVSYVNGGFGAPEEYYEIYRTDMTAEQFKDITKDVKKFIGNPLRTKADFKRHFPEDED